MSTNTNHYSLVKPAETDRYNINVDNGNLDAIDTAIHGVDQRVNDLAKGVMEVSLAGGDVAVAPTDKELIIVTAAHATNKLLLPDAAGSRFLIINKDESNKAQVAAVGSEAIIKIDKDSAAMVAHNSQGAYKAISGGGGGGAFDVADVGGTLQAGLSPGTCLLPDENNVWRPAQNGIVILGADGKVYPSGTVCDVTGLSATLDVMKNVYIDSGGNPGNDITLFPAGYAITPTLIQVQLRNASTGEDKAYTENMIAFYGMPRLSTQIGLKVKKPATADGLKIYRSNIAQYAGQGVENWGTLVADITNDASYDGENEWLIDDNGGAGLTNNTTYYYKAFPYVGGTYNDIEGNNEIAVITREGLLELTGDNVAGSTICDDFKNNDFTANDVTFAAFAVGAGMNITGYLSRTPGWSAAVMSWNFIYRSSDTTGRKILVGEGYESGGYRNGYEFGINADGDLYLTTANHVLGSGLVKKSFTLNLGANTAYVLGFVLDRNAKTFKIYVNGVYKGQITNIGTISTNDWSRSRIGYSIIDYYTTTKPMELDQIRAYSGDIGDSGFAQLYNGGIYI